MPSLLRSPDVMPSHLTKRDQRGKERKRTRNGTCVRQWAHPLFIRPFFVVPFHQIDSQKKCAWDEEVHINELVSSCRNTGSSYRSISLSGRFLSFLYCSQIRCSGTGRPSVRDFFFFFRKDRGTMKLIIIRKQRLSWAGSKVASCPTLDSYFPILLLQSLRIANNKDRSWHYWQLTPSPCLSTGHVWFKPEIIWKDFRNEPLHLLPETLLRKTECGRSKCLYGSNNNPTYRKSSEHGNRFEQRLVHLPFLARRFQDDPSESGSVHCPQRSMRHGLLKILIETW